MTPEHVDPEEISTVCLPHLQIGDSAQLIYLFVVGNTTPYVTLNYMLVLVENKILGPLYVSCLHSEESTHVLGSVLVA